MVVCLRTVIIPAEWREHYLAWIDAGRQIRQEHGILAELVCEPAAGASEIVVITVWPSHLLTVSRFVLPCEGWRRRRDSARCNMVSSGPDGVCEGVSPR
jgi:hypothetical protein